MKRKKKKIERRVEVTKPCSFCVAKTVPDYKNTRELSQFLSERARIRGKIRTGICSKHQRKLSVAIKRARHLGLLPVKPEI